MVQRRGPELELAPTMKVLPEGRLRQLLPQYQLGNVNVVTFPETKLKEISSTLRKGLGLAGGVATVTADQIAKGEAND